MSAERDMLEEKRTPVEQAGDRFTSLQPTYEDSVPEEDSWFDEDAS